MARRNIIEEIAQLQRQRTGKSSIKTNLVLSVQELHFYVRHISRGKPIPKTERYFAIIRAIAAVQVYFKLRYAQLIDKNDTYLENCSKFPDIKIKLDQLAGLRKEKLSIGTFIAHFLQPNSLEGIFDTADKITGGQFRQLLSDKIQSTEMAEKLPEGKYWDRFYKILEHGFSIRHAICHDADLPRGLTSKATAFILVSVIELMFASDDVFEQLVTPEG